MIQKSFRKLSWFKLSELKQDLREGNINHVVLKNFLSILPFISICGRKQDNEYASDKSKGF